VRSRAIIRQLSRILTSVLLVEVVLCVASAAVARNVQASTTPGFRPTPYSVQCVESAFARAGAVMQSVYPSRTAGRIGYVLLRPRRGDAAVEITVMRTSPKAAALIAAIRKSIHAGRRVERSYNVVLSYRRRVLETTLVRRGVRQFRTACR
jgi:hypothetical protein